MIVGAVRDAAVEWGNPEITAEHLLYAAATNEPTRDAIAGRQLDPDQVAEQMKAAAGTGDGSVGTPALSPAAKRALRVAQQHAAQAGQSYVGPEDILLGIAATPDTPATKALAAAPSLRSASSGKQQPASDTPTLDEYARDVTAAEGWLAEQGFDPKFGARPLRGTVQRQLDNKLSGLLLKGTVRSGDTVRVDADGTGLVIETVSPSGTEGTADTTDEATASGDGQVAAKKATKKAPKKTPAKKE